MDIRTLVTRTLSGIVYVSLVVGSVLLGDMYFKVVFGVFAVVAAYEYYRIAYKIAGATTSPIWLTISTALIVAAGIFVSMLYPFTLMLLVLLAVILLLKTPFMRKSPAIQTLSLEYLGIIYIILPFLAIISFEQIGGHIMLILFMFILLWANDTFAYLAGSMFGKHKMAPSVSPNKSWEGFVGGFVGAIAITILLFYLNFQIIRDFGLLVSLGLCVVVVVFGTLGDLFESQLKRTAEVKDSGRIMPGHGGILDRLDSAIFAVIGLTLFLSIAMSFVVIS